MVKRKGSRIPIHFQIYHLVSIRMIPIISIYFFASSMVRVVADSIPYSKSLPILSISLAQVLMIQAPCLTSKILRWHWHQLVPVVVCRVPTGRRLHRQNGSPERGGGGHLEKKIPFFKETVISRKRWILHIDCCLKESLKFQRKPWFSGSSY